MLSSVHLKYTVLHVVRMGTVLIGILLIVWFLEKFEKESLECLLEILIQHTYWAAGHLFLSSYLYGAPTRWSLTLTEQKLLRRLAMQVESWVGAGA